MAHTAQTTRDPVCGMDVEISRSSQWAIYRGTIFHFCSSQCLENFRNAPALYASYKQLRLGPGTEPIPKRRSLDIAPGHATAIEPACRRIGEMMGITSVRAESGRLIVEYDLKQVTLSQIETVAIAEGLKFSLGLHGLRRWLWRSSESNELKNAAHPGNGTCCNHPPEPNL